MAASTTGALKAFIEAQGLGISVYRDQAPSGTARPYITVTEAIAITPDLLEDASAGSAVEEVSIDIWMDWKNVTSGVVNGVAPGGLLESYTLVSAVMQSLIGARLSTAPTTVYGVVIKRAGPRIVEMDENSAGGIVHHVLQVEIFRNL